MKRAANSSKSATVKISGVRPVHPERTIDQTRPPPWQFRRQPGTSIMQSESFWLGQPSVEWATFASATTVASGPANLVPSGLVLI